jgi:hypothetical protein
MRGLESGTQSCSLLCIVGIGPNPLRHQAPLLTFDGTLIDDMSFGTLTAQVLSVSNLPVRSADNPSILAHVKYCCADAKICGPWANTSLRLSLDLAAHASPRNWPPHKLGLLLVSGILEPVRRRRTASRFERLLSWQI